jgi:H/ACA ribonucleoprotein complex subunit 4
MNDLPFEKVKRELFNVDGSEISKSSEEIKDLLEQSVVVIDKPAGPTSHQVSDQVKKILNLKKAGHSGTLDPNVTGVLPVAFNRGTKVIQALLNAGKEYVCVMHVHGDIQEEKLRSVMSSFIGTIKQLPPVKSAVKRAERFRKIYYLDVLEIIERDVLFKVGCEAGTYIRKLCFDIGEKLGCGAHMAELRRTKAGPFNESHLIKLHDLADAFFNYNNNKKNKLKDFLLPIESAIEHLPKIWVKEDFVNRICHGQNLRMNQISQLETPIKKNEMIAVLDKNSKLVLLGESLFDHNEFNASKKEYAVKTLRVFKFI